VGAISSASQFNVMVVASAAQKPLHQVAFFASIPAGLALVVAARS